MASLVALRVADPPSVWTDLGFSVDRDGCCRLGSVQISLVGAEDGGEDGAGRGGGGGAGIVGWTLSGVTTVDDHLDGLPTAGGTPGGSAGGTPGGSASHPNGSVSIDHVVVSTADLDRTVAVFEEAGLLLRRRRDAGATYGTQLHQAFFRVDDVIIEVVGPPPTPEGTGRPVGASDPSTGAAFFGLAITVADLAQTGAYLGDRMRPAKDAVQAGRQIATLARDAGSSVALAFMSPPLLCN